MSARIIVTGGSGFLGTKLCHSLRTQGHQVLNLDLRDNPEVETRIVDVRNQTQVNDHLKNADAVFHLAALIEAGESVKRPQDFIDTNVTGTINVLNAMIANHVPIFIFSSSAAIYGDPISTPIHEDDRTLPINPYGVTKLAMEGLVASSVKTAGLTGMGLRYFNLYGPGENHQPETHAIPRFIEQISHDQPVTVWGDGGHIRDYIYIDDVVSAHLLALDYCFKHPQTYQYFNLSTEQGVSVAQLIQMISTIIGRPAKIANHEPRLGDPQVLTASAEKARKLLNWQPQVDLQHGLTETVKYFL